MSGAWERKEGEERGKERKEIQRKDRKGNERQREKEREEWREEPKVSHARALKFSDRFGVCVLCCRWEGCCGSRKRWLLLINMDCPVLHHGAAEKKSRRKDDKVLWRNKVSVLKERYATNLIVTIA